MSYLKYALVFEGHLLLILWRIIVSCFICVRTHLITIIGDIQFVVVRALKILLLRNLILIILDILGLVIDGIFSHQGIIRDHASVSLVQLLDPSPLLHLLLLLHLKHLGQIQKLAPAPSRLDGLDLVRLFQVPHEILVFILRRPRQIPTVHVIAIS